LITTLAACRHVLLFAIAGLAAWAGFACRSNGDAPATATPAATATASATASAVPSPTAAPLGIPSDPLDWQGCGGGFECARIDVPADPIGRSGRGFSLPLIRRPAEDPERRIGSLLVNPGGPGVSGVEFVRNASLIFSADVRARFDIVGWDPRGVAGSEPAVDCVDDLDAFVSMDPSPDSTQEQTAEDGLARAFAEGCAANSGSLLPYLTAEDTARDMERIRAALGDEKLTYFGFSYGTFYGAIYAHMFPTQVRALVLDAVVDPSITAQEDAKNQTLGLEAALNAFLADCAANPDCSFYSNGDPAGAFDALMAQLEAQPIAGDSSLEVGQGIAWLGVISALYDERQWPTLAEALLGAQQGNGIGLLALSNFITGRVGPGSYSDELEQRIATVCVDSERLTREEKVALSAELAALVPRLGNGGVGPAGDPCDFWPVPSKREPMRVTAEGAPPILVLGTTGDPITPYQQAQSVAEQLSSGVLLTLVGERHTSYGGGSSCIDEAVDAYLIELAVPAEGTRC
jgi:pimeloyl-ACP methyl ester carboxylesterase